MSMSLSLSRFLAFSLVLLSLSVLPCSILNRRAYHLDHSLHTHTHTPASIYAERKFFFHSSKYRLFMGYENLSRINNLFLSSTAIWIQATENKLLFSQYSIVDRCLVYAISRFIFSCFFQRMSSVLFTWFPLFALFAYKEASCQNHISKYNTISFRLSDLTTTQMRREKKRQARMQFMAEMTLYSLSFS